MTVSVVRELEAGLQLLSNPVATEEEQNSAIEHILDYADNIDNANDFCKIGGMPVILSRLDPNQTYDSVKSNSASLIAELAQNNPFCQSKLLELDALNLLLPLLSNDTVCVNALRAISSLSRNFEPTTTLLIEMGGLECLVGCLQSNNDRLKIQTSFLLRALCLENPELAGKIHISNRFILPINNYLSFIYIDKLTHMNAINLIASQIVVQGEYSAQLEATLSLIHLLASSSELASNRCCLPELHLQTKCNEIIQLCESKPECQEITQYCLYMLHRLADPKNTLDDNHIDR